MYPPLFGDQHSQEPKKQQERAANLNKGTLWQVSIVVHTIAENQRREEYVHYYYPSEKLNGKDCLRYCFILHLPQR